MSCQIKENELFMSCQLWETTIVKLIKTTEKQNNNHACFIITHCSKSCNICKCSVTFVYHTIKLELFITNTIKLSQTKRSRQRKKVAPAKKVALTKKCRASKKSRASKKKSRQQKKRVAPEKKSRAKGKKVFTRMKERIHLQYETVRTRV